MALRALRSLGICWGLAAVAILIPIAHLILVPAFLVAGPILAAGKLRETATIVSAHGACPGCGREQDFKIHAALKEAVSLSCGQCHRGIRLVPQHATIDG